MRSTDPVSRSRQFVWTLKTEAGMYFCFERWMSIYGQSIGDDRRAKRFPMSELC